MSRQNEGQARERVLVDGANGYLGTHLVAHLLEHGYQVRCLVRKSCAQNETELLERLGAEVFRGDLTKDLDAAAEAFTDVEIAVHLIGSVAPRRGETFQQLHLDQTSCFARLCQQAQVKQVVMISTLGAKQEARSEYHRTKWQAESILRQSNLPVVFLRPSLLVGRTVGLRDSKLVNRYRLLIQSKRFVPLIDGGRNKIQPLFIADMVHAARRAIEQHAGQTGAAAPVFELGGANVVSMAQFVQALMDSMRIQKRLISIPPGLAKVLAIPAELLQPTPTVSRDQVILATTDNICVQNDIWTHFQIEPQSLELSLKTYEGRSSEENQVAPSLVGSDG
jgi:NADH dehydrogenase